MQLRKNMTAQISDRFIYKGEKYSLIGIEYPLLVPPILFGMMPTMIHTACYRGYYCTYEITGEAIILREMTLSEKNGNYLSVDGVEPELEDHQATYRGLSKKTYYSGRMRLAKDFIDEFYIHNGFQKASAFQTVLDITFDRGRIIDIKDRSEDMEKKRGAFKKRYDSGFIGQSILDAFSLDMELE